MKRCKRLVIGSMICCFLAAIANTPCLGLSCQQESEEPVASAPNEDDSKAEKEKKIPTVADKAKDWERFEGFQPFFWDPRGGKIWLEISDWDRELLFVYSLSTGLGSNPVGLDRGQFGSEYVCQFVRVGPKILLKSKNLKYRALTDEPAERQAVEESFAQSILWGGKVGAETGTTVLVDVTDFLLRDNHGIAGRLKQSGQGDYSVDLKRSAAFLPRCQAFPQNSELEATLTFSSKQPGNLVRQVAPAAKSISLRQHLSFVQLPDDNYEPRRHDPRCPSNYIRFADYSSPIDQPLEQRWINRHRLQKKDPAATKSEAVEPIVYYVDSGAPQLIREALVEGASWWNQAFEAAGFENAFQVKLLPPDADPMDVRYNVIQWVHRSTRGWSYGRSVIDPRTGEIIKGHVTLGSLRVRQDRLLFDGLLPPSLEPLAPGGDENCSCCGIIGVVEDSTLANLDERTDPVEIALARIRQLSAHEVGHTLGFAHNFAASTYADRASVMDYPAPRVKITEDGKLDLSDAYGVGIGDWDKWAVQFAYTQFHPGSDERQKLNELVDQAIQKKMLYLTDADSRPAGAAHPLANLWDNGREPISQLAHVMRVRRIALSRLSAHSLLDDQPVAALEQVLVPIYLHHRYQVDATAKVIGGALYTYAVKNDGQVPLKLPTQTQQRQALLVLLSTLNASELAIPESILNQLPPKPYSSSRDIERFEGQTSPLFDPLSAARIAADITIGNLLNARRVSRLAMLERSGSLTARELMVALVDYAWRQTGKDKKTSDISRVVRQSLNDYLFKLIENPNASVAAKSAANFALDRIKQYVRQRERTTDQAERSFAKLVASDIQRFEQRPHETAKPPTQLVTPPGSPIGNR